MKKNTKEQADKSTQEYKIHAWKKHTRAQKKLAATTPNLSTLGKTRKDTRTTTTPYLGAVILMERLQNKTFRIFFFLVTAREALRYKASCLRCKQQTKIESHSSLDGGSNY